MYFVQLSNPKAAGCRVKPSECPLVSCSKTLRQDQGVLTEVSLIFRPVNLEKLTPGRLIYPLSADYVLRSPELLRQSAQPAGPRPEDSSVSRPPHRSHIRGPDLPGAHVPPRPPGDPVPEHIRWVQGHDKAALGLPVLAGIVPWRPS